MPAVRLSEKEKVHTEYVRSILNENTVYTIDPTVPAHADAGDSAEETLRFQILSVITPQNRLKFIIYQRVSLLHQTLLP